MLLFLLLASSWGALTAANLLESTTRFQSFQSFCFRCQQSIISSLEKLEGELFIPNSQSSGPKFRQDPWEKFSNSDRIGHGITAVIEKGNIIEKGAVSTTILTGELSKERASAISSRRSDETFRINAGDTFYASALSIVLHSRSPMLPTFRADVRYFEVRKNSKDTLDDNDDAAIGWFGGGADLTPYYLFEEDVIGFHQHYKAICDKYSKQGSNIDSASPYNSLYEELKKTCDDYFFIPSRNEHRGVGGIFFDDLTSLKSTTQPHSVPQSIKQQHDNAQEFTQLVAESFLSSYEPIIRRRISLPYSDEQRHWQLLRRGRYVEFNLVYDRGVRFGLVPGGRTEAVLVSCPPVVAWDYDHQPKPDSKEAELMAILKTPRSWC